MAYPNVLNEAQRDLRVATLPLGIDLSVAPADLWADDAATIHAAIHNGGELAAAAVPVVLRGPSASQAMTVTLPLIAAGDVVTATFNLSPQLRGLSAYTVAVDPAGGLPDVDTSNNQARLGMPLGLVMLPSEPMPDTIVLSAVITQGGPIYLPGPVTATLTLEDVAGDPLGAFQVNFPESPASEITVTAPISAGVLGPGHHLIFWSLDASSLPANADRDAAVASLDRAGRAGPGRRTRCGSASGRRPVLRRPSSPDVQKRGETGPAATSALDVWDGRPGKGGSHRLLRLPLPGIQPMETATVSGTLQLGGLPWAAGGLPGLYLRLDPDNVIEESNENNNLVELPATS